METYRTIAELRRALAPLRDGSSIGLVPTMGALHAGHAALIAAAASECDLVVVSVFVNAPQFDDAADLEAYPRDLARDAAFAARSGAQVLFAPEAGELYPPGFATWVDPSGAAEGLEANHRPGHFRAVATVCVKLFGIVQPTRAYFGRKDAQQVSVVKQVVADLNLALEVRVIDTVRDPDGLALSSRNDRLSPAERARAAAIPRALQTRNPERATEALLEAGIEPEYVALADLDGPTLVLAARVGSTRLIDNVRLEGDRP